MKILEINDSPTVRAYTHHMFINAILEPKGRKELLSRVHLKSEIVDFPMIHGEVENFKFEKNVIEYATDIYSKPREEKIYKYLKGSEDLIVRVEKQNNTRNWGIVYLFLCWGEWDSDDYIRVGQFCNGKLLIGNGAQKQFVTTHLESENYFLRLKCEVGRIVGYISSTGDMWTEVCNFEISTNASSRVGISFDLSGNEYYDWLFSNHIQLMTNLSRYIPLDYLITPFKQFSPYTYHKLINFLPVRREIVERKGVIEFIQDCIDDNLYVEIYLDEFYIEGRASFGRKNYKHANLVYGYDQESLYLVGVSEKNKCITNVVTKEAFLAGYYASDKEVETVYVFDRVKDVGGRFCVESLKKNLEQYLAASVPGLDLYHIVNSQTYSFGMDIYGVFMFGTGFQMILEDIRISYMFAEHKKCMVERVKFLYAREHVSSEQHAHLKVLSEEIFSDSSRLVNMILKHRIKLQKNIETEVINILQEMKTKEMNLYSSLLQYL